MNTLLMVEKMTLQGLAKVPSSCPGQEGQVRSIKTHHSVWFPLSSSPDSDIF